MQSYNMCKRSTSKCCSKLIFFTENFCEILNFCLIKLCQVGLNGAGSYDLGDQNTADFSYDGSTVKITFTSGLR